MKRIIAMAALCVALAGCVYGGGPSYGYYGGSSYSSGYYGGWGASGYPGPPPGEQAASPE